MITIDNLLLHDPSTLGVLLFFLYAEIHYTFKGVYSRLKIREPEIIADAPHRVEPGSPIPILCLIKDAHKYPLTLKRIKVRFINLCKGVEWDMKNTPINQKLWYRILEVKRPEIACPTRDGKVDIDVAFEVEMGGQTHWIKNDNYRGTSHLPLKVFLASDALPRFENWYFGDLHYHSDYTEDQVEFGAPLLATLKMAKALGLSFSCATDHSYDLDDQVEHPLKNDPQLPKWKELRRTIQRLNRTRGPVKDFIIIPGEEVSCGNSSGRNVHLLVLNNKTFIPGCGDSAESWFHNRPRHCIAEILQHIDASALAFAAHPLIRPPLLEFLLLRRGQWQKEDCAQEGLNGLQVLNGTSDHYFEEGIKEWVQLLLAGRKIFIVAGNDAHGNFNRFRQIGFPFFTMKEHKEQIFGKARTGVYILGELSTAKILTALKCGHVIITDGPIAFFTAENEKGARAIIGDQTAGHRFKIQVKAKSTPEFGKLEQLVIFEGDLSSKRESVLYLMRQFSNPYCFEGEIEVSGFGSRSYLRLGVKSKLEGKSLRCLSNPIWVNHSDLTVPHDF